MKKLWAVLASLVFAFTLAWGAAAYNVQAPNSWDDADKGSWEYKTVEQMVDAGKSPAYTASYFDENRHISRYELSGIIVDLLDNGKDLTDADNEALAKMKKSYSRELEARGWHEPEEESPTPILEIHGDLRLRHTKGEGNDARARLGFQYNVSDNTTISAGEKAETD